MKSAISCVWGLAARWLGCVFLAWTSGVCAAGPDQTEKIQALLTHLHENGQFNGSLLVAREGSVIFRNAFGQVDGKSSLKPAPSTPSNIASLAKQFTAMTVMMLAERGKLNYDDPISAHIPKLRNHFERVTIRHLLTHTSGIPDVGDLGIDHPNLTEREVLDALLAEQGQFAKPGAKYRYSNAGYILLAMIVEQASGQFFGDFLDANIFQPLGMGHTALVVKPGGFTKGDGGIYSTVDDLFKWDQALYTEQLVRPSTLAAAFVPGAVREGTSNYGFGWKIGEDAGSRYVWHTGKTENFRAYIGRWLGEKLTVIILTNRGDSRRLEISDAIVHILRGLPFTMPKLSIAVKLEEEIARHGVETALKTYHALQATKSADYDFSEPELNEVGYGCLSRGDPEGAVRIFELNARQYPHSSNAFDSLGEAYMGCGRKNLAVKAYQQAVALDPANFGAREALRKLQQ